MPVILFPQDTMFQSSNPILGRSEAYAEHGNGELMTSDGATNKSILLFAIIVATAAATWMGAIPLPFDVLWMAGLIGGLVIALVLAFKPQWSPVLAPVYAVLEGAFVGAISVVFNSMYPGIVMSAVAATLAAFLTVFLAYRSGLITVTPGLMKVVVLGTAGLMLLYVGSLVASLFGAEVAYMHDASPLGFGISIIAILLASFNLLIDLHFLHEGEQHKLPKYMEWYFAFGLMVTLVWLYIEMLRLLGRLRQ